MGLLCLALAFVVGASSQEPQLGSARVVFQVLSFPVFHDIQHCLDFGRPHSTTQVNLYHKALFE